jgi:hypothetical protein
MRIYSQNLGKETSSKLWHGRAWLKSSAPRYDDTARIEWAFLKDVRSFGAYVGLGGGDSDSDLQLHVALPFLFSIYLTIANIRRCKKERRTGISIHSHSFWVYLFDKVMESNSTDPWYASHHSWDFPWQLDWRSTEILKHKAKEVAEVSLPVWSETKSGNAANRKIGKDWFVTHKDREAAEKLASETYPYTYTLKSGELQLREATVHVVRMNWKARWWPLIPLTKSRTSIDIKFNQEVGERTGSWKGGCTGCGWDMLNGETPLDSLRRMERERKFT